MYSKKRNVALIFFKFRKKNVIRRNFKLVWCEWFIEHSRHQFSFINTFQAEIRIVYQNSRFILTETATERLSFDTPFAMQCFIWIFVCEWLCRLTFKQYEWRTRSWKKTSDTVVLWGYIQAPSHQTIKQCTLTNVHLQI